jgi:hypothetical protein
MAPEWDSRSGSHLARASHGMWGMGIGRQIAQYGGARLARKLGRAVPVLGAVIALVALRKAIRNKGLFGGVADTALDATPGVGAVKTLYEVARGDLIPNRTTPPAPRAARVAR